MKKKHPARKEQIKEQHYQFQPEEEIKLKVGNILHKLDMNAAPGPSGLRNGHLRLWTGVFAPDEDIQHLEELLTDMANDKLPGRFMQVVQATKLMTLVKAEKKATETVADPKPVQISNTLAKVGDKAMMEQCQAEYVKEMMPKQVGVGVKFKAELLAMGLRMTLHLHKGFIIINIDIVNAYNEIKRAAVMDAHSRHIYLRRMVPFLRAKLTPTSKLWACRDNMEHHEGLVQDSPIS